MGEELHDRTTELSVDPLHPSTVSLLSSPLFRPVHCSAGNVDCSSGECSANVSTNFENSCEENWGPLSLTTTSGIPCLANKDFMAVITLGDDVDGSSTISG